MTKGRSFIAGTLLVACIACNALLAAMFLHDRSAERNRPIRHVAYIGINDKDTKRPLYSFEEALNIVNDINFRHTDGFTALRGSGFWKNPQGERFHEETLIYVYYGISRDALHSIMDEVLKALNQESVLIDSGSSEPVFYP